jgi:hypothetical protein
MGSGHELRTHREGKHASVQEFGVYNQGLNLAMEHPAARPSPPSSPCPQRAALLIIPPNERFDECLLCFRDGHEPGGRDRVGDDLQSRTRDIWLDAILLPPALCGEGILTGLAPIWASLEWASSRRRVRWSHRRNDLVRRRGLPRGSRIHLEDCIAVSIHTMIPVIKRGLVAIILHHEITAP